MTALRIDRHPNGPRVYCAGMRVHHGTVGALGLLLSYRHPRMRAIFALILAHDIRDFPFTDSRNH